MNWLLMNLIPVLIFAGAILVILLDAMAKDSGPKTYLVAIVTLILALLSIPFMWQLRGNSFGGLVVNDTFSVACIALFTFAALITILLSQDHPYATSQYHSLILLTLLGMIFLVSGTHFLMLFIGLEILSLSIYILASFSKKDPLSSESGIKYFLLGSFASAFFLYGMAFVFGASGSLQLNEIAAATATGNRSLFLLGIIFLIVGYGFKISLAPFHMWTPDVYEGAPTPITAFMAATVKAAALASLFRVLTVAFGSLAAFWSPIIWILSVITMFAGNLSAIGQNNLKRLLAYSSVAHAGYMLLSLLGIPADAQQSLLYYFAAYVFMNLGAFTIVAYLERTMNIRTISDFGGLIYSRPLLGICMTLFLVSLGGMPPTAGFFGKFYLFRSVLQHGYVWAVVLAVINSAISFYYYLRVVIAMYTPAPGKELPAGLYRLSIPVVVILVVTLVGTVWLGVFPGLFLHVARAISMFS